ncbi:MAG: DUF3140 domain-containing protein [Verrucomicrobiaceae bacterium]|nr:MAG: DUF3140 domain-containing protein [Verrucomicrobiaceae bacterium]
MTEEERKERIHGFKQAVNMTARQLGTWLETKESGKVGWKEGDRGESVGHRSGRSILRILRRKAHEYTTADLTHMAKVSAFVKRHLAQRPSGDVSETPWRYSLMNWGHDPTK